jgi:hypothetical protein
MLTVFWSPLNLSLVEILSKGIHSDSQYFCSNILFAVVQNQPSETPEDRKRRMVLHFDTATAHTAKCTIDYLMVNRLTRAPYPTFSPDLASSDFYLLGKLKMVRAQEAFADEIRSHRRSVGSDHTLAELRSFLSGRSPVE